jgi:hypothetical protein
MLSHISHPPSAQCDHGGPAPPRPCTWASKRPHRSTKPSTVCTPGLVVAPTWSNTPGAGALAAANSSRPSKAELPSCHHRPLPPALAPWQHHQGRLRPRKPRVLGIKQQHASAACALAPRAAVTLAQAGATPAGELGSGARNPCGTVPACTAGVSSPTQLGATP